MHFMTIRRGIKIALGAVGVLLALFFATWLDVARPGIANRDERAALRAFLNEPALQPRACYSMITSPFVHGGVGNHWLNYDGSENLAVIYNAYPTRARSLSTWTWSDFLTLDSFSGFWDRLGCSKVIRVGTPTIIGDYAFVDTESWPFFGTIAFKRNGRGWKKVGAATQSAGPVY